jgi:Na+/proline symporter
MAVLADGIVCRWRSSCFSCPYMGALAIEQTPLCPAYPHKMTMTEVPGPLVLPHKASTATGRGGAVAILLILFMADKSVPTAQLITVRPIISFEVCETYDNKVPRLSYSSNSPKLVLLYAPHPSQQWRR